MEALVTELVTTGQAARELGVSSMTIRRWLIRGKLKGWSLGGRHYVDPRSLASLKAERRIKRVQRLDQRTSKRTNRTD